VPDLPTPSPAQGFTIDQVAASLGVHRATILREIKRGHLRAVKVATRTRILQRDLDAYFGHTHEAGLT
jgi:excisionase family DNA binding protein